MTEDNDNSDLTRQGGTVSAGPGARLRATREAAGLSVDDVAHQLRLETNVIKSVESDDLGSLGAPVFVKGYLRSYARLLDLPEQELVDAWQPAEQDPEEFRSLSMQTEVKTGTSISIFMLWLLFALLILGSVIYLLSGDDQPVESAPAAASVPAERVDSLPSREADFVIVETEAAELVAEDNPVAEIEISAEPVATPEPEQPAVAVTDNVEIQLTFNDECWVELSDASRRLLYGLEKAGSVRSFSAKPPLRFFVGNVDAVDISFSGKQYAIPQRVRTGRNTARFALSSDDLQVLE